MLDLILKDITDVNIRENFFRLTKFLNSQILFEGNFEFFEIDIPQAATAHVIKHGLKFIPVDIIVLSVEGDFNYFFQYQDFTKKNIYVTTLGPVRIRFLAGKLSEEAGRTMKEKFTLVPPASVVPPPPVPATTTPRLTQEFDTDAGTAVGDLVVVDGVNHVTKITTNSAGTIPNGMFGVGYYKPSALRIEVLFIGIKTGYAGFTTGDPLFISTTGTPTHTVPATGTVQQIGFATSTTEFFLQMMLPMRRA